MSNINKKILLVEDNPGDVNLIQHYLKEDRRGTYDVSDTRTIKTSMKKLAGGDFDAIILDLGLPDSQGLDSFYKIYEARPDIPIIVLTGLGDDEIAAEAIRAGAQDYLIKGEIQPEIISRAISYSIERKQAEIMIREGEDRFRTLAASTFEGIGVVNNGVLVDGNEQLAAMLGYELEELIGSQINRLIFQDDLSLVMRKIEQGSEEPYEFRCVRKDGQIFFVEARGRTYEQNGISNRVSVLRDTTEQKLAQGKIKESEAKHRSLFETSPQGILILNLKGTVTTVNSAFLNITGCSEDEIVDKHFTKLPTIVKQDLPKYLELLSTILKGNQFDNQIEFKWLQKDGSIRIGEAHLGVLKENGKISGLQATIEDTTEIKQHEREMEAIANLSLALRDASTREKMISIVLNQMAIVLDAVGSSYVNYDRSNKSYFAEFGDGVWTDTRRIIIDQNGMTARVIRTRELYVNNRTKTHPDPEDSIPEYTGLVDAVACTPLIAQDEVIGVLWLGRNSPINQDTIRMLSSIANIAASAIQRVSLYEKTVQNLQRLEALHNIDTAINASLNVELTLQILITQVIDQLKVDATSILLFEESSNTLRFAAGKGFGSTIQLKKASIKFGKSFAGRAVLERRTIKALNLHEPLDSQQFQNFVTMEDFSSYIGVPLIAKSRIVGVLEVYNHSPLNPEKDWMEFLETLAGQAAITIDNATLFNDLQASHIELRLGYDQTIEGWAKTLEMRDDETEGHSQRVTNLAVLLAKEMGINPEDMVHVRRGSLLHDIGKMAIPDRILQKPGKLTDEEWNIMHQHPVYAYEWLSSISFLKPALDIPYSHHEKWDGTGYPRGLKGADIPISARIFSIVDVYDALRSNRPYRKAWSRSKIIKYLKEESGSYFEPRVVDVFLKLIESDENL